MRLKRPAILWLLALASTLIPASADEKGPKPTSPMPSPDLSPARVMEIQVEALQFNDRPTKDAGIATTFRFASPANRKLTGPLERFAQVVKGPAFGPIIGHRVAGYDPIQVQGNHAARRVTIIADDGRAIEYEFQLSKDAESGCWFTDGVIPSPAAVPVDPGKLARTAQIPPTTPTE